MSDDETPTDQSDRVSERYQRGDEIARRARQETPRIDVLRDVLPELSEKERRVLDDNIETAIRDTVVEAMERNNLPKLCADGGSRGVPEQYREIADESRWRIPPGCPHCEESARAYYLGDVGETENHAFVTEWVCSACETPITLYTKGKGGGFVDEKPDLECLEATATDGGQTAGGSSVQQTLGDSENITEADDAV